MKAASCDSAPAYLLASWLEPAPTTRFDLSSNLPDPANYAGFAAVLGLLAALAVSLWLLRFYLNWRDRPAQRSTRALFRELCRAHHLGWGQRRLLARVARVRGIQPAARLFLEPSAFEDLAGFPALSAQAGELSALKAKLFGG